MSKKNWIYLAIISAISTGSVVVLRWALKKLKQGKLDRWLSKDEKENLMEALEEFLEINGGKDGKG